MDFFDGFETSWTWSTTASLDSADETTSWSYRDTTTIVFLVIGLLLYLPLTIHFAYPLWRAKDALIFEKRQSKLTLYALYALLINIISTSIVLPFFHRVGPWAYMVDDHHYIEAISIAGVLLLQCSWQFFYSTLFIRLWLFYYGIRYNMISGSDWMGIIDNDYDVQQSWLLRVHSTLGNKSLLMKINCIFNILFALTDAILCAIDIITNTQYSPSFSRIFLSIIVFVVFIFASIIYYLLRKVKYFDDLYILKEFQAFYKVVMAAILVVIVYALIFCLILLPMNKHLDFFVWITIHFGFQTLLIFNISVIYVMSRWVFNQVFNDESLQSQYGEVLKQASVYGPVPSNKSDGNECKALEGAVSPGLTLLHILQKQEYFCVFMQHLSHEFSMECLLSLIEFIQFREMYAVDPGNSRSSILVISEIKLPPNTPKSSIVFNKEYDPEMKAKKLYEKYICIGSDYEINISAKDRNVLRKKHDADSFGDPFQFDKSIEDMISLLRYSFSRFQGKIEYQKMERFESK